MFLRNIRHYGIIFVSINTSTFLRRVIGLFSFLILFKTAYLYWFMSPSAV
jgi:hypothetical protein